MLKNNILLTLPYPESFWRFQAFKWRNEEKNHCAAGESKGALYALPSGIRGHSPEKLWLLCILNSSKQKDHIVGLVHERSFVYF